MAHSLTPASATIAPVARSGRTARTPLLVSVRARVEVDQRPCTVSNDGLVPRRSVGLGLVGTALGLVAAGGERRAAAAARRPPPPPPSEKKDPNVSGVQAKVLASKKRKEAMKETIAKLREKGKSIKEEPSSPAPPPEIKITNSS